MEDNKKGSTNGSEYGRYAKNKSAWLKSRASETSAQLEQKMFRLEPKWLRFGSWGQNGPQTQQ
eukprot:2778819-Karenia_brevis.AAC.1